MFYMGYCELCNYLDADLDRNSLFDTLLDHQVEKHKDYYAIERETVHIFRVFQPYRVWLDARGNLSFWEAWRHRKKTGYILARIKELQKVP